MILTRLLHPQHLPQIPRINISCKKIHLFPHTHHFLLVNAFNVQGAPLVLPTQKHTYKPRFFGMEFSSSGMRSKVIKGKKPTNPTFKNSVTITVAIKGLKGLPNKHVIILVVLLEGGDNPTSKLYHGNLRIPPPVPPPQEIAGLIKGSWWFRIP